MSSFIVHCVAFASLAFVANTSVPQYSGETFQYLTEMYEATKSNEDNVKLLQKVMNIDFLWMPILNETVIIEHPNVAFFNQYEEVSQEKLKTNYWPFEVIKNLLKNNTFAGTDVRLAMDVFRSAMACLALKHISFQGFILHSLLNEYKTQMPIKEKLLFIEWMKNMIHISIDKLMAIGHSLNNLLHSINKMRKHLNYLKLAVSGKTLNEFHVQDLREISMEMYAEIEKTCVVFEGEGHYSALIANLNRENRIKELEAHRIPIIKTLKDASEIVDIDIMHKYKGDINIVKNIQPDNINTIPENEMKRIIAVNYITMNFLFSNLPVKTLSESQWFTLSKDKKTHFPEETVTTPQSL